jgi:hypothetical protein
LSRGYEGSLSELACMSSVSELSIPAGEVVVEGLWVPIPEVPPTGTAAPRVSIPELAIPADEVVIEEPLVPIPGMPPTGTAAPRVSIPELAPPAGGVVVEEPLVPIPGMPSTGTAAPRVSIPEVAIPAGEVVVEEPWVPIPGMPPTGTAAPRVSIPELAIPAGEVVVEELPHFARAWPSRPLVTRSSCLLAIPAKEVGVDRNAPIPELVVPTDNSVLEPEPPIPVVPLLAAASPRNSLPELTFSVCAGACRYRSKGCRGSVPELACEGSVPELAIPAGEVVVDRKAPIPGVFPMASATSLAAFPAMAIPAEVRTFAPPGQLPNRAGSRCRHKYLRTTAHNGST